jgi:hypothetical protein
VEKASQQVLRQKAGAFKETKSDVVCDRKIWNSMHDYWSYSRIFCVTR